MTNQQEPISETTQGIEIFTFPPEFNEVASVLTISEGSNFDSPTCIANNIVSEEQLLFGTYRHFVWQETLNSWG
jgi:hypothetical protein